MSCQHLTDHDRYVIHHLHLFGLSRTEIGRRIGRHRSTIARELRRSVNRMGEYFPEHPDRLTRRRRQAAATRLRIGDAALMAYAEDRPTQSWSPDQIAGRLEVTPPKVLAGKRISQATIYRCIRADAEGAGKPSRFSPVFSVLESRWRDLSMGFAWFLTRTFR